MDVDMEKAYMRYADDHSSSSYTLMEMTESMLSELLQQQSFVISGAEDQEAVLSTKNASFIVREAPSSNSLLLLDSNPLQSKGSPVIVLKTLHAFYQLNKTSVNMEKLKSMLWSAPLNLFEEADNSSKRGDLPLEKRLYTLTELEDTMQCSQLELEAAFKAIGAFEFEGYVRILDVESEYAVAKNILLSINAEGLDPERLYREDVLKVSKDENFPALVLEHAVDAYLSPLDSTTNISTGNDKHFKFDAKKYAALVAHVMLRSKPKDFWTLAPFMLQLREKIPDNVAVDVTALEGLVCQQEHGKDVVKLTYLPASSMSHNPRKRLTELFKHKPKWTFSELLPYLQDLVTAEMNEEQLLVANTRSSTGPSGVKLYSTR